MDVSSAVVVVALVRTFAQGIATDSLRRLDEWSGEAHARIIPPTSASPRSIEGSLGDGTLHNAKAPVARAPRSIDASLAEGGTVAPQPRKVTVRAIDRAF